MQNPFNWSIGPPIDLATFLFSIVDSKRRLGTFKSLFWFDSADSFLFPDGSVFDWKVVRVLMVDGLSSQLSKSSLIHGPNN